MIWSRWSGAGNSFYLHTLEVQVQKLSQKERSSVAKALCELYPHAPTDGVLLLEPVDSGFKWDFYNADGSTAEMCGNAARCAVLFLAEKMKRQKFEFLTIAGPVSGEIINTKSSQVLMPTMKIHKATENELWIDTGVPHVVLKEKPTRSRARHYRPQPEPAGSNVTFIWDIDGASAKAVTYERGVENYTAACGTGAVAAAAFLSLKNKSPEFEIHMPGGRLRVKSLLDGSRPTLAGPAQWDYDLLTNEII